MTGPTRPRRSKPHAFRPPPDPAHQCADRRSLARPRYRRRPPDRRRRHPRRPARHRRRRRAGRHRDHRLPRQGRGARADRHARLRRRTRRRIPRDLRLGEPGRRRRRRHHHRVAARHQPGDRRARHGRFRAAARPRHRHRPCPSHGGAHQGHPGPGDDRDRPAEGRRRRRLHRRGEERHQRPGDAPRPHLCPRFRRPHRASHRGPRPGRRRRDERGRVRRAARPRRRSQHGGDGDPGARHPAGRAGAVALPRGLGHLRGFPRGAAPRQGCGPARHRRDLDQPPHLERDRCRLLPHLLQGDAAAAARSPTARRSPPRSRRA